MIPNHKKKIMIHCLDTKTSWGLGFAAARAVVEVRRWHVHERKWRDIAYAEIIDYNGARAKGRDLDNDGDVFEETGAGAFGHNKDTIHIALCGGHGGNRNDPFSKHFTQAQDDTLRAVIAEIQVDAGRELEVLGHNQVSSKACPCFSVPEWIASKPKAAPKSQGLTLLFSAILSLFGKRK